MLRALAVVAIVALVSAPAAAQMPGGIEFTVKAGVSFGDVSNKNLLPGHLGRRDGFAAGLALASGGLVGFGVEALIAQRGVKSDQAAGERKLDYVDFPGYVRIRLPLPLVKPFLYAGPQVSIELRCRAGGVDCPDAARKKTTYAGVIGGGVLIGGGMALSLEGRYIYGLNDLKLGTLTSGATYQTRSFLILAGLRL